MIDNEEYTRLKESVKHCVLRKQYIDELASINKFLDAKILNDKEFINCCLSRDLKPMAGVGRGIIIGWVIGTALGILSYAINGTSDSFISFLGLPCWILSIVLSRYAKKKKAMDSAKEKLRVYKEKRKKYNAQKPIEEEKKQKYTKKLQELTEKMKDRDFCIIPQKYWDVAPLLIYYVDNCRAHDLESAINIYEQDMHNRVMEQKQSELLLEQRKARIASEIAAENAARAAESADISATASMCNLAISLYDHLS